MTALFSFLLLLLLLCVPPLLSGPPDSAALSLFSLLIPSLQVSRDPTGREVMVDLVGTAVREAARGTSSALAERTSGPAVFAVITLGLVAAWLVQLLLRMTAVALFVR